MNKRVKELAVLAGYKPLEPKSFADDLHEVFLQKFAKLIVQECADVCLSGKNKENWRCTDSINKGFSDAVLDHFGVEL